MWPGGLCVSLWTVHGDGRSLADGEVVRSDERPRATRLMLGDHSRVDLS